MRIVITGGAGFLGHKLAVEILDRDTLTDQHGAKQKVTELVIFDRAAPTVPLADDRVQVVTGDLGDPDAVKLALGGPTDTIFHLAAVVSGEAEADHELGLKVNLDGTRALLDFAGRSGRKPKFIFASSLAVYGGPRARIIDDFTTPTPKSSYGTQKLVCEFLVDDYDRRGLIDGRSLRFPTVAVRPGKANAANSSFISSVVREPVAGRATVCPVSRDVPVALISPNRLVAAVLSCHEVSSDIYGWPRAMVLPAIQVTVADFLEALEARKGPRIRDLVSFAIDPAIEPMVKGWPASVSSDRARALGIATDGGPGEFIEQYLADIGQKS
ncbi:MAG: NAD-dependent epimerase/dehydratase family protein [Alphaproteobacteria bacterium]|nr:NAD-dependent epimerase/dehydratase family protein [Alphaproteobacteria bacterium]